MSLPTRGSDCSNACAGRLLPEQDRDLHQLGEIAGRPAGLLLRIAHELASSIDLSLVDRDERQIDLGQRRQTVLRPRNRPSPS